MNAFLLSIGLITLFGALSPLFTFLALFQQKEWRIDRLQEHLQREGILSQLWGRIRLLYLAFYMGGMALLFAVGAFLPQTQFMPIAGGILLAGSTLLLCAATSLLQLTFKKQRTPVWTGKAKLIALLSIVVNSGLILLPPYAASSVILLAFLPFVQPFIVLGLRAILYPLDTLLKKRIMLRAQRVREEMKDPIVIGIAGSVGKTTTKELIAHLLQDLTPHVTPAHVNTEMGVAKWLLSNSSGFKAEGSRVLAIEMGAYKKGEIKTLCTIAQPTIGVITAIGGDHLALFGNEEAIIEANAELLEALPKNGHAFINGDSEGARSMLNKATCKSTIVGTKEAADVLGTAIKQEDKGITLTVKDSIRATSYELRATIYGLHNVENILLAVAVAQHLGVTEERIAELLKTFKAPNHTFTVRNEQGITLLDDTYNISPLSFKAALNWAALQEGSPKVLLTSGLLETGSSEEAFLTELGTHAKTILDRAIFTTKRGTDTFAKSFGKDVELLSAATEPVAKGAVLLCVGRMPESSIQQLLPQD